MAAVSTRVTVTMKDRYGNSVAYVFHVAAGIVDPTDARIMAIVNAVNAFCNPVGLFIELSQVNVPVGTATAGAVYISTDKALFPALDDSGQPHNYKVPGLKPSILQANSDSIDMTNANVITYHDAVVAWAMGPGNVRVQTMLHGYRTANRKPLKK